MIKTALFALLIAAGCTKADQPRDDKPGYAPAPTPAPAPPAAPKAKVELTSVTLADDCGGSAPVEKATTTKPKSALKADESGAKSKMKRRCEQTSMQLEIEAFTTTIVKVKSVELFDESGKSLGTLTASTPRMWSSASATYETWDEKVAQGPASNVTYVLTQPTWDEIGNRWNRTFTVKAVISLDGTDMPVQRDVELRAETSLPPGVKT